MGRFPALAIVFALTTAGPVLAQTVSSTTGAIDGRVSYAQQAVLPGA